MAASPSRHAGGLIERIEAAALVAAQVRGWKLADSLGALHVRCVESIRYAVTSDPAVVSLAPEEIDASESGTSPEIEVHEETEDAEGWHQDEWSILTVVLMLSTANQRGGNIEVDRGKGPLRAEPMIPGDLIVFRSWDAHRSTPLLEVLDLD